MVKEYRIKFGTAYVRSTRRWCGVLGFKATFNKEDAKVWDSEKTVTRMLEGLQDDSIMNRNAFKVEVN